MQEPRLTPISYIVLGLVSFAGEATPYRLKQLVAASVGNFWTLQHAQLYTEPERLAKAGRRTEPGERARRRRPPYSMRRTGASGRNTRRSERRGPPRCPAARALRWRPESPRSAIRSSGGRRLWFRRMATAAEPRPAELPLPGGREGARVRLRPLLTGQMKESRLAWRRAFGLGAKDEDWLLVPVPAFLVEHPGVGPILIDTGFHPSVSVKPQENLGRLSRLTFRDVEMTTEQAAPAQLRARGIEPSAVKVVLMTHLHVDRASAISEFPESTFVVSAAEWAAASSEGDAAYEAPDRTEDEHLFRRSLREIRQYAAETPDALIVPGHDWEAWQGL